jgi:FAD/FMN-containing dehydrogenase
MFRKDWTMVDHVSQTPIAALRDVIHGRVIAPDDDGYDAARTVVGSGVDRRPAAIVRAADTDDVAAVVTLARDTGLELAVRGGGHSNAGHGVSEGGIVLDLRDMKALDIDVDRRVAWAGAGLTAAEFTAAAHVHGLAVGFGDTGSVGIGGITLGGGIGYLARKHGMTIDSLLAADIVTADGQLRRVDANTHPDLFWAIRGGGGNFGVVTRFQYRLAKVGTIVGGMLMLPATADVVAGFVAAAQAAPEELSAVANVMPAPPMPFVPAEHHGRLVIMALLVHVGEIDAGERAVAPFRSFAAPLVDMLRPMPYPEIYPPEDPRYHPVAAVRATFMDSVDRSVAEAMLDRLRASTAQMRVAQLRVLGGAMARVPVDATAFAHRGSRILASFVALYESSAEKATHDAWATEFAAAMRQEDRGAYVNFLGDEGEGRIREAYPAPTLARLAAIKATWDPTNLFRLNQNIPPALADA